MFYFDEEEIENIIMPELQQRVTEIKQRFDQRNQFYNQLRQNTFDINSFAEVSRILPLFTAKFNELNQKWKPALDAARQNEKEQIISFFKEANILFSEFENTLPRIGLLNLDDGTEVSDFKRETLSRVSDEIEKLKEGIDEKVDTAINHLLKIKSESLLEKDFSSNIVSVLDNSKSMSLTFFRVYIVCIVASLLLFISTFFIEKITNLETLNQITLRASIVAFLWVGTAFIYSHYRFYKTLEIKYSHLATLLGGGATHINTLIKDGDENVKNTTYEKLVNQFMDITDITKLFGKAEHPTIKSVDKALDLAKDLTKK